MKKILFLLCMLTFGLTMYAQTPKAEEISTTTISEAERLIDKYTGKVAVAIEQLAAQLQQPAEYVFKTIVKQKYLKGLLNFIPVAGFIFFLPFLLYCAKKGDWTNGDPNDFLAVMSIVFGIITGIMFIAIFICIGDAMLYTFNPEYYAIQDIVQMARDIL